MRPSGMTMVEMMATVAVLTVMTSLSVSAFNGAIDRKHLDEAIARVGQVANEARMRARQYRQPVRLAVVTTGPRRTVRWERLECSDSWGSACPSVACATSACGTGGCVCPEAGDLVEIPAGMLLPAPLNGLCFSAGSGAPKVQSSGKFCDSTAAAPAANALSFVVANSVSHVLELDPLTGTGRLVDCRSGFKDAALCP